MANITLTNSFLSTELGIFFTPNDALRYYWDTNYYVYDAFVFGSGSSISSPQNYSGSTASWVNPVINNDVYSFTYKGTASTDFIGSNTRYKWDFSSINGLSLLKR